VKKEKYWLRGIIGVILSVFALVACKSTQQTTETLEPTAEVSNTASSLPTQPATNTTEPLPVLPTPTIEEGTIITASGLGYFEINEGSGSHPEDGNIIDMNVVGYLQDGTMLIDQPITAILGREQLLPGWEEGVILMKPGGKAKLTLPPALAFGEAGTGSIPPNSTLILEVELISAEVPPEPTDVSSSKLVTTDSGLQYYDIASGTGETAGENSIVATHFSLWVKQDTGDNTFILSSSKTDPISFVVGRGDVVFPGWEEGVLDMAVGGKRLLIIPPELALGETGGRDIPPNSTLIMEIELVSTREPAKMTEVKESDYTVTESGLKFYDIVEGTGATPTQGQSVTVHYTGWLEDGTQFDSSLDKGEPFTFQLGIGSVIAGWDEGVATMKVGGKRQLVIPAELGYGDAGAGNLIPPGATLIFDVELLGVEE